MRLPPPRLPGLPQGLSWIQNSDIGGISYHISLSCGVREWLAWGMNTLLNSAETFPHAFICHTEIEKQLQNNAWLSSYLAPQDQTLHCTLQTGFLPANSRLTAPLVAIWHWDFDLSISCFLLCAARGVEWGLNPVSECCLAS